MSNPSIGIIGAGFVGTAICKAFVHYVDVKIYDIAKDMGFKYEDVIRQDVLFFCLPTPMLPDGNVDISILEAALKQASSTLNNDQRPALIKSTIPPLEAARLQNIFSNLEIIHNPEFLTERTANLDYIQQSRILLGIDPTGPMIVDSNVTDLFYLRFPGVPIRIVSWNEAALIKYTTNVFFCVKLSLFNEICQVCKSLDIDYNTVIQEVLNDGRIGRSHAMIPGMDGKVGWGGSCFCKDINGYMNFARGCGVSPIVAEAAWAKNLEVRPEKDWMQLKGRAVSE